MEWQIWFTLGIVLLALAAMVREVAPPDLVLMAALFSLAAAGVLTPAETFAGFANPAVATIGALFMISAALRETGALDLTLPVAWHTAATGERVYVRFHHGAQPLARRVYWGLRRLLLKHLGV